jgi:hypothetical protein
MNREDGMADILLSTGSPAPGVETGLRPREPLRLE